METVGSNGRQPDQVTGSRVTRHVTGGGVGEERFEIRAGWTEVRSVRDMLGVLERPRTIVGNKEREKEKKRKREKRGLTGRERDGQGTGDSPRQI